LGVPENFVGVSVADAGEEARIGERAFESVIGGGEASGELCERGVEDFEATGVESSESGFALDDVKRSTFFGAGFGPEQGAVGEVESGEAARGRDFDAAGFPVEAAGDHEMQDEPEIAFEADADAFAEAAELEDFFAERVRERRSGGAEEKRTGDAEVLEGFIEDALVESIEVDGDVRQFRHGVDKRETRLCKIYRTTEWLAMRKRGPSKLEPAKRDHNR